jgi:phage tail sheath protein FI
VPTPTLNQGPGVYIQELPSPVLPIVGVPTSVAAFYGEAPQGIVNDPYQVNSWADYENEFGGLNSDYPLSYAVYLFFLNGGSTALVVRYDDGTTPASVQLSTGANPINLSASSPGGWGTSLGAIVDTTNLFDANQNQFNLTITLTTGGTPVAQETYPGASLNSGTPQYLPTLLAASQLVTAINPASWKDQPTNTPVDSNGNPEPIMFQVPTATDQTGSTGTGSTGTGSSTGTQQTNTPADTSGPLPLGDQGQKTGIYALLKADIFNILCLPAAPGSTYTQEELGTVADFCTAQRAMLIVDPPMGWPNVSIQFSNVTGNNAALLTASANAAVYYPNLVLTDATGASFNVGPSGAVAGVWAATDNSRGVWKAPAGTAATITGIAGLAAQVDNGESGMLNPLAVNTLRMMPAVGPVVWGARTTVGVDQLPNQWKYVPVRRIALYIEESLRRGTLWAVFEPNDEPLWSSLRLNVTTFMQGLFRQGAFAGTTPSDAYLVQCDANNNPPDQVALGIVNILVGFAPLYPAEFVVISIQQQALQD